MQDRISSLSLEQEIELVREAEKTMWVSTILLVDIKEALIGCLQRNQDIFSWAPEDLSGVDPSIMEHHLNIMADARLVKQKHQHFGPEKDKGIREEVQKLIEAKQVREVCYPTWLSNAVLVPKMSGK